MNVRLTPTELDEDAFAWLSAMVSEKYMKAAQVRELLGYPAGEVRGGKYDQLKDYMGNHPSDATHPCQMYGIQIYYDEKLCCWVYVEDSTQLMAGTTQALYKGYAFLRGRKQKLINMKGIRDPRAEAAFEAAL